MSEKHHSIEDLNKLYSEAETADSEIFSEQRSNVLLIAGEHYSKKNSRYWDRIRDTQELSKEQKLRITKNHIQKITKIYVNNIISHAPGTKIAPKNAKEYSDQKASQLNQSAWHDIRVRHKFKMKVLDWAQDYIGIGEVAVKLFWDPNAGKFKGFEQEVDPEGNPQFDEMGQPVASTRAVFTGDLVFERVFGFNLLRDPSAKSMDESKWLGIRKMVSVEELKAKIGPDEEKLKMVVESSKDTFTVFDGSNNSYYKTKDQCMLREYYFKPCMKYPNGYYYITTEQGILWEGELPFGVFPIFYTGFDAAQTSPRHRSIVKVLRPYQAEVNRCASKMAEHQITLGDDKIVTQSNAKVSSGAVLPGVRQVQVSGSAPTVIQGRTGEQYLAYSTEQIDEMYNVANVREDLEELPGQQDPYAMLFRAIRNKKKFVIYTEKFEQFLIDITEAALRLYKEYVSEDMLIPAIGKAEYINIPEFKSSEDICYQIEVEAAGDDIETMFGRQLVLNHAIQYIGPQLAKDDIGKLIRSMPFGNVEESLSDLTLDYDTAQNLILSLDRGENVQISPYDNHVYMLKRLGARVRQPDYQLLSPQIQKNYLLVIQAYEQMQLEQEQKLMEAEKGFIPSGGARVKVDYYVPSPNNPEKVERATVPAESIDWLIKRLAEQGSSQEALRQINQGIVADMAGQLNQREASQMGMGADLQGPPQPGMSAGEGMML